MTTAVVQTDFPAAHVARLLVNRPDKRNAIDFDVREALTCSLRDLLASADCRALIFGGVGGVFSAGGDLPSMGGLNDDQARARMTHIHGLCRLVGAAGVPVISAFEGITAGAAVGLGLLGDVIVMGEGGKVLFPFMKLGLTPDWGTLLTLPRRVGPSRAIQILASTQPIGAAEALRLGLVDQVVPDGEVMSTVVRLASEYAMLPADAFARMKKRIMDPAPSLDVEFKREEQDQVACLTGQEFRAGYGAFMEKRSVNFLALQRTPHLTR